jgi:peptidoglycan hydrolase CwlO-like protein
MAHSDNTPVYQIVSNTTGEVLFETGIQSRLLNTLADYNLVHVGIQTTTVGEVKKKMEEEKKAEELKDLKEELECAQAEMYDMGKAYRETQSKVSELEFKIHELG